MAINESEQESVKNNISEIEEILNASSMYISIGVGEKKVLQFLLSQKLIRHTIDSQ
jgi:hypothetical protein